jgi:hypothetical protein
MNKSIKAAIDAFQAVEVKVEVKRVSLFIFIVVLNLVEQHVSAKEPLSLKELVCPDKNGWMLRSLFWPSI